MKGLDKTLFPEDGEWLKGLYADLRDMFGSFEYFAKYIRKRFPNAKDSEIENFRAAFLIESIEVYWRSPLELERRRTYIAYGSSTIKILIPDLPTYTVEEKKRIEDDYHERYTSRIKEGHVRLNALLWYVLSDRRKEEVRKYFPPEIDPDHLFQSDQKR